MVIKGGARGGAISLAQHLQRTDTNERAELRELRGVAAEDLDGALCEIEAVASGARSARHFYHASINTRADEVMTPQQWHHAIDQLERELGLTNQPRAVVAHLKEGREHVHVVWSRIDLETMTAISDSHNYRRHELVARALEEEFGHARVQGAHIDREGERPDRTPSHAEMQQAARTGIDPKEAKVQLTEIWNRTDSGKAFAAAIEEQGWILARGDRRDFVIVDLAGEPHSLARRIDGVRAKDIRNRMADVDVASVPTIGEAEELQFRRQKEQPETTSEYVGQGGMSQQSPDEEEARRAIEAAAQQQRDHARAAEEARRQTAPEAEHRRIETPANSEQQASPTTNQAETPRAPQEPADPLDAARQRAAEEQSRQAAKEAERIRIEALARENADHQITQAEQLREQRARLDRFEADRQRQAEEARQETERKREADARGQQAEGEIRDAGDRYRMALGQHYDVKDPYGSLARSAMAEYGAFIRDREQLKAQIAREQDPEARRALELRQDIEANDYMAITSKRIASQSEIITGRRDSEEAVRFRERAAGYEEQSKELRQQYRDLAAERAARDAAKREAEDKQKRERDDTARRDQTTESRAVKEEKARDATLLGRGEISDAKAERIARIREQGRQFESAEKVRETGRSQDKGGRSR